MTLSPKIRCAVYTRKSSEEGLDQEFNSLDAQRESCEAYIKSQAQEGWRVIKAAYDDGGFSGGSLVRPGLKRLLTDVERGLVDVIVVYKVDRLTRSLADFAKIVDVLEGHGASFVSVTQHFNTTSSMGRLTLNVLLSFAQFEREVTGERIRDKFAASRKRGMWMGGNPPLGYDIVERKLVVNQPEADQVREIFKLYLDAGSVANMREDLHRRGIKSKRWISNAGNVIGGKPFSRGALYYLLQNRIYFGDVVHKGIAYPGEHPPIVPEKLWTEVQEAIKGRAHERSSAKSRDSVSWLAGRLFDDAGNRMTPSYTKKPDGRRYRYYVSQALIQGRKKDAGSLPRVPAQDIEDQVDHVIRRFIDMGPNDRDSPDDSGDAIAHLRKNLRRAQVGRNSLRLDIDRDTGFRAPPDRSRLPSSYIIIDETAECVKVEVPIRLRSRGSEKSITTPDGANSLHQLRYDTALLKGLARAFHWREVLQNGSTPSVAGLSRLSGFTERYVRSILPLAFVAPDIIDMILDGRQPAALSLARLIEIADEPSWVRQKAMLGIDG